MNRLALLVLAWACIAVAQAQPYPERPITITVTSVPGGVTDLVGRAVAQRLSESWGQQVVIENKGGGAHVPGMTSVAKSMPDGYSLLIAEAGAFAINPALYGQGRLPYDEEKDFIPITGLVRIHQALLGHASLPAANLRELIALAKSRPGELTYATAGIGSALHMNMVLFASMAGIRLQPVHYRGATPALTDVIAGHVNLLCVSVGTALPPLRAGAVKLFGIGSLQRLPSIPEMPTVAESGLPGFEAGSWFGLFAPAATPREIVLKINKDVTAILDDPAFREKFLAPQLFEPMASSPDAFAAFIAADKEKWSRLIREQHLSIQ